MKLIAILILSITVLTGCDTPKKSGMSLPGRWLSRSNDPIEFVDLELSADGTFEAYGAESHISGNYSRNGDVLELKPDHYLGYSRKDIESKLNAGPAALLTLKKATVDEKNKVLIFELGTAGMGRTVNLFKTPIMARNEDPNLNSAEQMMVGEYEVAFAPTPADAASDMYNRIGVVSSRFTLYPDKTFKRPASNETAGTWKLGNAVLILSEKITDEKTKKVSTRVQRFTIDQDGLRFADKPLAHLPHRFVKR